MAPLVMPSVVGVAEANVMATWQRKRNTQRKVKIQGHIGKKGKNEGKIDFFNSVAFALNMDIGVVNARIEWCSRW